MKGQLFLLPTVIAEGTQFDVIPHSVCESIKKTKYFLCENERSGRRFISSLKVHASIEALEFKTLDKDTLEKDVPDLCSPLLKGENVGLLSESGCPGVADPGALAVRYAHQHDVRVIPHAGPSSIMMALMASGLNGQCFAFHGYLPIDTKQAENAIKLLERESMEKNQTQIFIETPHRNNNMLSHLIRVLRNDTLLCTAINLTSAEERIISKLVASWKGQPLSLGKVPVVFLFLARSRDW